MPGDSHIELQSNSNMLEKLKPLNIQATLQLNSLNEPFQTIGHGDSLMETPHAPDRMLNSIFQTERQRQSSVMQPGSQRYNKKVSLRAVRAKAEHDALIEEVKANHYK